MGDDSMTPRTPAEGGNIPWRVVNLEDFRREQQSTNKNIDATLIKLNETITALDGRLKVHDESRKFWGKVWLAVVTLIAVSLVGFLLRISYIVQGAKLP